MPRDSGVTNSAHVRRSGIRAVTEKIRSDTELCVRWVADGFVGTGMRKEVIFDQEKETVVRERILPHFRAKCSWRIGLERACAFVRGDAREPQE